MSHTGALQGRRSDQRTPLKFAAHEQRLRNCKKVFDQLHRTQMHTFVVRKMHLENFTPRVAALSPLIANKVHGTGQSDSEEKPSKSMSLPKKQNKDHIEIIKKMLEISSHNQPHFKPKREEEAGDNEGPVFKMRKNTEQFTNNQGRKSRLLYDNQPLQKPVRSKRDSLQKERTRMRHSPAAIQNQINSTNLDHSTQGPRISISKSPTSFIPRTKSYSRQRKYQSSLSEIPKQRISVEPTPLPPLSLQSYTKFINAPADVTELHIHFNFTALRKMSPAEAWKNLDIKNGKMIETLLSSILAQEFVRQ